MQEKLHRKGSSEHVRSELTATALEYFQKNLTQRNLEKQRHPKTLSEQLFELIKENPSARFKA